MNTKFLIVISGPTAVGKTALAISIAKQLHTEIINADSRQVYHEMVIGTAIPSAGEMAEVKHHFIGHRSIHEGYDASRFEQDVIAFLNNWYENHNIIIMAGGSGMYIDAVCRGIDDLPSVDAKVRRRVHGEYAASGLEWIQRKLKQVDPEYYAKVDLNNPQRIMKALEISEIAGRPYSSLLTGQTKIRNFTVVKIGLDIPRQALHERINRRVEQMMESGLLEEVTGLYVNRHLNALNTVGYKELFDYMEGKNTLGGPVEKIQGHTRQYARRQLTWFRRDSQIHWFHPDQTTAIMDFICHPNHADGVVP
jgi:tRNA dimethylallyltransferase